MFAERTDLTNVGGVNLFEKWINLAYIRLTTRNRFYGLKTNFYFPELEVESSALSTADGTKTITTPTDALVIREVWDSTNDVRLNNISTRKYIEYTGRSDSSSEGKPIEWLRRDTKIYLYPTPNAIYSLYAYYRKVPAILASTAKTAIGVEWDEVILQLAYIIGKEWLGEFDKARAMKSALAESFSGIIGIYEWEEMAKRTIAKPEGQVLLEQGYK
jgi:hypothetical protein